MNKFKKLLLTLAPLSAVAIATPIILTSCSTNATNPSNPSNPGGGNGDTGTDGKLQGDSTNLDTFVPTNQGLYKSIEESIKAGEPGKEEEKFNEAFTKYTSPTETDVKDAINIWSFNKWFDASKKENITFVSNLTKVDATSKVVDSKNKWNISFTYKFEIVAKIGDKTENVLGEKTFTASEIELTSTIPFTTQATEFVVNGEKKLDEVKPKSLYAEGDDKNESQVVTSVKEFLSSQSSNFDAKDNFKTFIKNKNIVGEGTTTPPAPETSKPVWQPKDPMAVVSEGDPTTMTVTFTEKNTGWAGGIKKGASLAVIKKELEGSKKSFILGYIKDNEGWNISFDNGTIDANDKTMGTFNVTLSKSGVDNVILKLVFKGISEK